MGFFSDLFSNKPAKDAALYSSMGRQAGLTQATGTLNEGYGEASQWLDKIPGYIDTAKGYFDEAKTYPDAAKGYYDSAKNYLESAKEPLNAAQARFNPLAATSGQGFDAYAQLYGVGGGDPTAAVRAQPGYQFSQNEGREQVMRSSLGTGQTGLQSGNTLQSIFDRGADIGLTKWQQYAEGLKPFLSLAPQIAGQQGTYDVGTSALEASKGAFEAQKAPLEASKGAYAGSQAALEASKAGYATGQAGLDTNLAGLLAQYQTGTANANSDAMASAELARGAAAKNVFDAVMGGAKLAVGAFTGGGTLGTGPTPVQNFTNMFKQG